MMLSLIVPCFNEEEALPYFYQEATKVIKNMDVDYELLFIDDGSSDFTLDILRMLSKEDEHVHYISFSRNFGKEAAMYAGFSNSIGDYVVVMDADLQHPPTLIPQMLSVIESGEYDSVAAQRVNRQGESKIKNWFSKKFYKIINMISDLEIVDGASDFRMMTRKMIISILSMEEYNRFLKGIYGWVGYRTYYLPYENIERIAGKSKWNYWKLFKYAINGILDYSNVPLMIASFFGILVTIVSIIMMLFIIAKKVIFGFSIPNWTFMLCVVIFLEGIQMLFIGVVGQYIAKIYLETKHRPLYIIQERK